MRFLALDMTTCCCNRICLLRGCDTGLPAASATSMFADWAALGTSKGDTRLGFLLSIIDCPEKVSLVHKSRCAAQSVVGQVAVVPMVFGSTGPKQPKCAIPILSPRHANTVSAADHLSST